MRIAIATYYDLSDIERGSGSYYFLARELAARGHEVSGIVPNVLQDPLMTRLSRRISRSLGYRYRTHEDVFYAKAAGRAVSEALGSVSADFLLTNDFGVAACTDWPGPTVIFTDGIFPVDFSKDEYPQHRNLSRFSVWQAQRLIRRALRRVALCCLPADWSVDLILEYRILEAKKVVEIPFGANINPVDNVDLESRISRFARDDHEVRFLFVGKDWARKGGEIAVEVIRSLRRMGAECTLDVVGTHSELSGDSDPWIRFHGYLNKHEPAANERLAELYRSSDVFLLPTRAEGFGVAFAEASAYGLPSLAFDVMGVRSVVQPGVNGTLVARDTEHPENGFAEIVLAWRRSPEIFESLCRGARRIYEQRLNWKSVAEKLEKSITAHLFSGAI